ncbi:MAG TPA: hypothetical protein V6D14_07545 [Coleofasciculaceae cyanobacterium]
MPNYWVLTQFIIRLERQGDRDYTRSRSPKPCQGWILAGQQVSPSALKQCSRLIGKLNAVPNATSLLSKVRMSFSDA